MPAVQSRFFLGTLHAPAELQDGDKDAVRDWYWQRAQEAEQRVKSGALALRWSRQKVGPW